MRNAFENTLGHFACERRRNDEGALDTAIKKKLAAFVQAATADGQSRNLEKRDGMHDEPLKGRLVERTCEWQCRKKSSSGSVWIHRVQSVVSGLAVNRSRSDGQSAESKPCHG